MELARLRQAVNASGEVIFMTDREGVFTFVNAQFERLYGYAAEEVVGRTTPRVLKGGNIAPEQYSLMWQTLTHGDVVVREFVNRAKNGTRLHVQASVSPIWDDSQVIVGFLAIQRDVTERRQVEDELRFQQLLVATAQNVSLDGILVVNEHGHVLSYNERFAAMWDPPADALATRSEQLIFDSIVGKIADARGLLEIRQHLAGHPDESSHDEVTLRDGRTFDRYTAPMQESGKNMGRVFFYRDVTASKKADAALRESQALLQLISENVLDLVAQITLDGTFLYASPSYEQVLGYAPRGLIGISALALVHPEDLTRVQATLAEGIEHGTPGRVEFRTRHADGHYVWVESVGKPLLDATNTPVAVVLSTRDISERKRSEEQLRQSQKLEAIGSLAGGIAHDFNNLLTAILGYTELAIEELTPESPARKDLEEVQRAGHSAESLTRQLLIFSRKSVVQPQVLHLNDIVSHIEKILRRVVGEDVEFTTRLANDLGAIKVDAGQLEQVLMNLAVNARDAMPTGGTLTIETAHARLDTAFARAHGGVAVGTFDTLAVTDTGIGMTPEVLSRIFDPFFTTKGPEKGTGLGLANVLGIVQQSGGYLTVTSAPGLGSTFTVYFPRVAEPGATIAVPLAPVAAVGGTETILLVEDNEDIRMLATRALRTRGYSVMPARHAAEALAFAGRPDTKCDLLVTDIVMPGLHGRSLADRLRESHSALKVLFTSGYSAEQVGTRGADSAGVAFLRKPYTPESLARKVREVLG